MIISQENQKTKLKLCSKCHKETVVFMEMCTYCVIENYHAFQEESKKINIVIGDCGHKGVAPVLHTG